MKYRLNELRLADKRREIKGVYSFSDSRSVSEDRTFCNSHCRCDDNTCGCEDNCPGDCGCDGDSTRCGSQSGCRMD